MIDIRIKADIKHSWHLSPAEARAMQERLADKVILENQFDKVETVAGIDVGFPNKKAQAAVVVLGYPRLNLIEYVMATKPVEFPYIPGLLSFREGPVVIEALQKLNEKPDLLIFDGQGIAHPRRLGIAAHLGVLLDIPSIGCAKSRLCGEFQEPPLEKGTYSPLLKEDEKIGFVLRTRSNVRPVFISPGHKIDFDTAVHFILTTCTKYRLPETTRWAHRIAGGFLP